MNVFWPARNYESFHLAMLSVHHLRCKKTGSFIPFVLWVFFALRTCLEFVIVPGLAFLGLLHKLLEVVGSTTSVCMETELENATTAGKKAGWLTCIF